jgi:D-beta-D-heptose 7-phosphate kinase / D-beta-D-heptose 1-phosphate adenosyltransferase
MKFTPKVVVIGDLMVDCTMFCDVQRVDQASAAPVGDLIGRTVVPGGAGNVAWNLHGMGVAVGLAGVLGTDSDGKALRPLLETPGFDPQWIETPDILTTTKTRFVDQHGRVIVRMDSGGRQRLDAGLLGRVFRTFEQMLKKDDIKAVVVSDYDKGVITRVMLEMIINACNERAIPVIVDPCSKYKHITGPTWLLPNLEESRQLTGVRENAATLARRLSESAKVANVAITCGRDGIYLYSPTNGLGDWIRPNARIAVDTTGAGDTVTAGIAIGAALGASPYDTGCMARSMADVAVSRVGTTTVRAVDWWRSRAEHQLYDKCLGSLGEAVDYIERMRQHVQIVMANGVFDLFHGGHVALLDFAKEDSDEFLVVLINSDESARRYKGATRPVIALKDRMQAVAMHHKVDMVVPFDAVSVYDCVQNIKPDVLVKGPDYTKETVVGHDIVTRYGGKIRIAGAAVESTTEIITRAARASEVEREDTPVET